jgi:hypothetical protein
MLRKITVSVGITGALIGALVGGAPPAQAQDSRVFVPQLSSARGSAFVPQLPRNLRPRPPAPAVSESRPRPPAPVTLPRMARAAPEPQAKERKVLDLSARETEAALPSVRYGLLGDNF